MTCVVKQDILWLEITAAIALRDILATNVLLRTGRRHPTRGGAPVQEAARHCRTDFAPHRNVVHAANDGTVLRR